MPKLNIKPAVIRLSDSVGVSFHMGLGHVSVQRHAKFELGKRLKWGGQKARISWSGGNGQETVESTNEFIHALAWATHVAITIDKARDPMKLSDQAILNTIPAPADYSGVL